MRLQELLSETAGRVGDRVAVIGDGVRCTYAELDRKSDRLAAALVARDVKPGDCVVTFMDDSVAAVVAAFAVVKADGVLAPVDPASAAERLTFVLDHVRAAGLVTEARLASVAAAAMAGAPTVRLVVLVGGDRASASQSCMSYEDVVKRMAPLPAPVPRARADSHDPGALLCHGSTPVAVTHGEIAAAVVAASERLESRDKSVLRSQPIWSALGLYRMLAAVRVGATLLLEKTPGVAIPAAAGRPGRDHGATPRVRAPMPGAGLRPCPE